MAVLPKQRLSGRSRLYGVLLTVLVRVLIGANRFALILRHPMHFNVKGRVTHMPRTTSKRRSRRVSLPAILAPLLVVAVLVIVGVSAGSSQAGGSSLPPFPTPGPLGPSQITGGPVHNGSYGIPAIQPRAALASSTGPHFTAADAAAYIKANRAPYAVPGTPDPTIVSITFLPAKTVVAQYGGSLSGTTDTTPICVVILSGTFLLGQVPLEVTPTPYHQGDMIFDGYTGYLLESSVG